MCDQDTAADNDRFLAANPLSRRDFGVGMSIATLAALAPSPANAATVAGRDVTITTPDGNCDAWFVAPTSGKHPGVLIWPDIMGLRPAFQQMARRLAESGYAVLVVNQFYRSTKAPFLAAGESFDQPAVKARIMPWYGLLTPTGTVSDGKTFVTWLDAQPQVDRKRGIGVTGYCMGGPMVVRTAAARSDRVRAGGSFHGGGLVTDKPDSPHLLVPQLKGGYLFAIAANDDARAPGDKGKLHDAFASARTAAEIEVYTGTMHGWCPPDSKVYNQPQAEKAWARQLALFKQRL